MKSIIMECKTIEEVCNWMKSAFYVFVVSSSEHLLTGSE